MPGSSPGMTTESDIQHAPVGVEHGFLHHLRQRRMREDGVHQLFFRGFEVHGNHIALDEFGHFGADHVRAKQLAGLLVEDHFYQALILAKRDRLAVADERETADADLAAAFFRPRLREADGSNLRRAIGAARNHVLVHRVRVQALDGFDADDALMLGLVRQHRRPRDVADGVNAGYVGLAIAVDHDAAAIGLDAELFHPEVFNIADHADGRNHPVDLDGLWLALAVVDGGDHAVAFLFEFCNLGVGKVFNPRLLQRPVSELGDFGVFHRQDLRQYLDDRHFGTHGAEERREFDADGAGAHHQ